LERSKITKIYFYDLVNLVEAVSPSNDQYNRDKKRFKMIEKKFEKSLKKSSKKKFKMFEKKVRKKNINY
jgi:uncharacterized protein YeaO (DUF488 family)